MSFKCICGSKSFIANQMIRAEVVVNENGEFIDNLPGGVESNIYDAEEPYGPFVCERCGKEYGTLEAGSDNPEIIPAECVEGYHWANYPRERLSFLLPEDETSKIAIAARSHAGSSETILTSFKMNEKKEYESYSIISNFSIRNRIQRRFIENTFNLLKNGMIDVNGFKSIIDSAGVHFKKREIKEENR